MLKRKATEAAEEDKGQPRKRIRPLLQRETSVDAVSTSGLPDGNRTDGVAPQPVRFGDLTRRLLPALKVEKSAMYNFSIENYRATINMNNYVTSFGAGCSLHKVCTCFDYTDIFANQL